jgi:hypothetical protein
MSPLEVAIDRLYLAFADIAPPRHIDGCPCCIEAKQIPVLLATPLRSIVANELASYASSALLTVGEVPDYLYFLPRILEISVFDDSWWPDIEVTARAIHSTSLQSWPTVRIDALTLLLRAVIDDAIASCRYSRIDGWLCAIARMSFDVRPYLAQIEKSPAAVLQYFEDNAECLKRNELSNAFWELPNEGHEAIVNWFKSDAIRKIPFEAYGYVM